MANINFAGAVSIDSVIIKSLATKNTIDINNQVIGINIYEDLFSPFITGSISINDSVDLMNALPINGEEIVTLNIKTPGLDVGISADFYVYKCTDREYIGDRSVIYSLHIISKEAIVDINKKLSLALSGTYDAIIQKMVKSETGLNSNKTLLFEKSNDSIKFMCNYWSPIEAIDFICGKANTKLNVPSYIFYENRDGFNFTSLNYIYENQQVIQDFSYNNFSKDVTKNSTSRNIELDYKRITSISIPKSFDYMEDTMLGKYGSKIFSYDVNTKQYSLKSYDYLLDFAKSKHLNKYPSISRNSIRRTNSHISTGTTHYEIHTGIGSRTTDISDNQHRQSLLLQARSQTVNISVPGRFDYTVGRIVNLKLYKSEVITASDTVEDSIDKFYSGNYVISAINHSIYRDRHECILELIKDSFEFELEKGN